LRAITCRFSQWTPAQNRIQYAMPHLLWRRVRSLPGYVGVSTGEQQPNRLVLSGFLHTRQNPRRPISGQPRNIRGP
jgi:hypothetical protein